MKLPQHKSDFESVEALSGRGASELEPYVGDLMVWIQDMNWPIASAVFEILSKLPDAVLLPHITNALSTDDECWKYWVLSILMRSRGLTVALRSELDRLANYPTAIERDALLQERACDILAHHELS